MGKRTNLAKGSLAAVFLAGGGGAAIPAQAAAEASPQSNVNAQVASYFGPLQLESAFEQYVKVQSDGFQSFYKWYKFNKDAAIGGVLDFSAQNKVPPPPGFETDT